MNSKFETNLIAIDQIPALANSILQFAKEERLFVFIGQMGSGKTTLIKELCKQLGSNDNFSSPTYSIVNEYLKVGEEKIFHLDLYRLNSIEEALDLGIEDYISGEHYCFIEWPELIAPLLPVGLIKVEIKQKDNTRFITVTNS